MSAPGAILYLGNGVRGVHCLRALLAAKEPVAGVIGHVGRILDLPTGRYISRAWVTPLTMSTIPLAIWWLLSGRVSDWSWPTLFGCGLAGMLPYGAIVAAMEWRGLMQARRERNVNSTKIAA